MPALTFDDVPDSGVPRGPNGVPRVTIDTSPKAPGGALTFDDVPTAETTGDKVVRHAKDVGLSIVSGLDKGVAGLAGLPADLTSAGLAVRDFAQSRYQGRPYEDVRAENEQDAWIPREMIRNWGSQAAHDNSPLKHKPETTEGKYIHSAAEFVPSSMIPGANVRNAITLGILPGLASEAAGQATEGTALEPWARGGAALATGAAGAWFNAPNSAGASVSRATRGANQSQIDEAEALFQAAQQMGIPITRAEAVQHVTGGATNMGNLQRVVEGSGELKPFFAERPGQVSRAAGDQFDALTLQNRNPHLIGEDVATTARQAMSESPEGRILADTVYHAGPRVSPEHAGNVMQSELRNVYDRREGMRAALADRDYTAAREAPATIPMNGGHRVAPVDQHFEWPRAYPVTRGSNGQMRRMSAAEERAANLEAPVPVHPLTRGEGGRMRRLSDDEIAEETARRWNVIEEGRTANQQRYNIREDVPIVGERATEFAQVDSRPVLQHLDEALDTAKGAVRQGLQAARTALMKPDGTLDMSVAGLHNSRVAIDDLISQAKAAQANNTVARLKDAKDALDRALEGVPSYGDASRNFRAASGPLAPFGRDRAPGKIVQRDQYNENFTMPADRAPRAIQQGGPSAARDFNEVATPAAREAFEQHIVTQVLDEASKTGTDLSAASIRRALTQNEDLLRQYPGVRDRLESVAIAREGLARVEASPLGQIAKRDSTTRKAIDVLFPRNPLAGSQQEIGEAVGALAARSPQLARDLVRMHVETVFNQATRALATGANEYGGAGFAAALRGNPQQAANLEAAITAAFPNGRQTYEGFNRFLNILEATGTRQRMGSTTAFNTEALDALKQGGSVAEGLKLAATGGLKLPQKVFDTLERWRMGKNVGQIADILSNPEAGTLFRQLANSPSTSAKAAAVSTRLIYLAQRGAENSKSK